MKRVDVMICLNLRRPGQDFSSVLLNSTFLDVLDKRIIGFQKLKGLRGGIR